MSVDTPNPRAGCGLDRISTDCVGVFYWRTAVSSVRSNYPGIIKVCLAIIPPARLGHQLNWVTWVGGRSWASLRGWSRDSFQTRRFNVMIVLTAWDIIEAWNVTVVIWAPVTFTDTWNNRLYRDGLHGGPVLLSNSQGQARLKFLAT